MDMLEIHAEAKEEPISAYNEFLNRFNPTKNQIFVFYEGDEDPSYYNKFIEAEVEEGVVIEELISGCRNNVIVNYRTLRANGYNVHRMLFIIDRDLSFWLNEDEIETDIFVTDGYSVENYLVCTEVFEKLVTQVKGFARCTKKDIDAICNLLRRLLSQYCIAMEYIMACAVLAKKRNRDIKLSLLKYSRFLQITQAEHDIQIEVIKSEYVFRILKISDRDDAELISEIINSFHRYPEQYHVRGKWLLPVLVELSEIIRLNASIFAPSLGLEKATQICSIDPNKAVGVLGPRCTKIPTRLKEYLDERLN